MRIAIVEDHAAERQLMAVMCAEYFKRTRDIGVECVTFADAESFIESWKDARYDLAAARLLSVGRRNRHACGDRT